MSEADQEDVFTAAAASGDPEWMSSALQSASAAVAQLTEQRDAWKDQSSPAMQTLLERMQTEQAAVLPEDVSLTDYVEALKQAKEQAEAEATFWREKVAAVLSDMSEDIDHGNKVSVPVVSKWARRLAAGPQA